MTTGKKILSMTLMFLLTGILYGQVISGIGFKSGLAYSTYSFVNDQNINSPFWRYGFTAGIFAEGLRTEDFSLQLEADFEQKGGNHKQHSDDPDRYFTLNMLSIPITARIFLLHRNIKPYLGAGPRVDIFLSKNDLDVPPFFPDHKSMTFGGTIFAGVQFKLSGRYLAILEASYSPDFTGFMDHQYTEPNVVRIITRNVAWELKTGILFDMAKK